MCSLFSEFEKNNLAKSHLIYFKYLKMDDKALKTSEDSPDFIKDFDAVSGVLEKYSDEIQAICDKADPNTTEGIFNATIENIPLWRAVYSVLKIDGWGANDTRGLIHPLLQNYNGEDLKELAKKSQTRI